MKKYQLLRKKYPFFIYKDYSYKKKGGNLVIFFQFEIPPDINFFSKIKIKNIKPERTDKDVLENFIFNLGLAEMISYWKITCSQNIIVKTGYLNEEQIKWWKDLIINGMSQYFYENGINFKQKNFLIINTISKTKKRKIDESKKKKEKIIIPIGGGKDSIVTLELMRKVFNKKDIYCFSLNPKPPSKKTMKTFGCKNRIIVERKIDKNLFYLNQRKYLNGHTPFSAYLAFLSIMLAYLTNVKYIAFSNERSSNEGNIEYLGEIVNHQYSKSFDFEKKFREYTRKYLSKEIKYFSFLRPLYELQISKIFSQYKKYFSAFLSCNEAFKTNSGKKKPTGKWCGRCPKCLFVFTSLYPFIPENKLINVFQKNLFKDRKLIPLMLKLIGERGFKPFECVGTKKESLVAFYLSWKKAKEKNYPLLKYFERKILPKYKNLDKEAKTILKSFSRKHFIPSNFEILLTNSLKEIK